MRRSDHCAPQFDILCTHPMFGPDSGRGSWKGLKFMYEKVRVGSSERSQRRVNSLLDVRSPSLPHPPLPLTRFELPGPSCTFLLCLHYAQAPTAFQLLAAEPVGARCGTAGVPAAVAASATSLPL